MWRRCRCRRWLIWRGSIRVRRRGISEFGVLPFFQSGKRRRRWENGEEDRRRVADPVSRSSLFVAFAFHRKVLDRAMHFALEGTARQAKFATRLIAYSKKADELTPDLSEVSFEIPSTSFAFSKLTRLRFFPPSLPDPRYFSRRRRRQAPSLPSHCSFGDRSFSTGRVRGSERAGHQVHPR